MSASLSLFEPVTRVSTPPRKMRGYQLVCDANIDRELQSHRAVLVVSATGTGKSHMMAARVRKAKRALVLAPQNILVYQAQREFEDLVGQRFEVEQGDSWASVRGTAHVVASAASIMRPERLERFPRDAFDEIIVDEADCFRGPDVRRPLEYFTARIVGFTATPHGMDKRIFTETAFKFDLVDAIGEGWLNRLECAPPIQCDIDLSKIKVSKETGDFEQEALDEAMAEVIAPVLAAAFNACGTGATLICLPGVKSAHAAAAALNQIRPGCALAIDGKTPEDQRRAGVARWKGGEVQFMANCRVFGRGFDFRGLRNLIDAAPTKSKRVKIQRIGRILRPLADVDACATAEERKAAIAASPKPVGLWIDLALNDAPGDLETPLTILAETFTDKERKKAARLMEQGGRDPLAMLLEARKRIAEAAAKAEVKLKLGSYDPTARRRPKKPAPPKPLPTDPPTPRQARRLGEMGVPVPATFEEAKKALAREFVAAQHGWCDYTRRAFAEKWLDVERAWALPLDRYRQLVTEWKAAGKPGPGWRRRRAA
jgi:superfamily II DNA or RNA helicase